MSLVKEYLEREPKEKQSHAAIAYLAALEAVAEVAPEVKQAVIDELKAQRSKLKLIASENYSSLAVQLAMGNLLTDKYAEGVPGHRFYAGCENVDSVEKLAADSLCRLFKADYAYCQPHSGADANMVAFWALLVERIQNPRIEALHKKSLEELSPEQFEAIRKEMLSQKLMGLSLSSGGHLTHGYKHNISGKMFQSFSYDVSKETGLLDYAKLKEEVKEIKPAVLVAGYSAYPRKINFAKMREIADSVGAALLVDMAHFAGLVAGGVFHGEFNPVPYADIVTSTTHKTLRGPRGGMILAKEKYKGVIDKGCPLVLGGPLPHVIAAKAIAFKEALSPNFKVYAAKIVENAKAIGEELKKRGMTLLTGGTDNHLLVLNLSETGLTGRQAESALSEAGITVNRNAIPFDPNGPWYTSGIRIGTPAITTLGMGEKEMALIAQCIVDILKHTKPGKSEKGEPSKAAFETEPSVKERVAFAIKDLLQDFPLYPEITL